MKKLSKVICCLSLLGLFLFNTAAISKVGPTGPGGITTLDLPYEM